MFFQDVFSLSISEGTIENILNRSASKSVFFYKAILEQLTQAKYIGSDETGAKVNGSKWWIWVWQNIANTFLLASENRGYATIKSVFPSGLPNATIGTDRWAAQLKTASKDKQLCFPHLLRDLNFLIESEGAPFAFHFKAFLKQVLYLRQEAVDSNTAWRRNSSPTYKLERRLDRLLARYINKQQYGQTATFQRSMIKYRPYLLTTLYDLEVPADNNASERAIRNVKVKQKVSGQFKSGQQTFCVLRSIFDTLRKRNLDPFEHMKMILAT